MGIDLATWRARIGLNYYHMCHPLQTRWRSSGGRLYQPGVASWGVGEVMNDTPLVFKGCMTLIALSLILQYVVHSWSKLRGRGGGGKVHCHWRGTTSQVRSTADGVWMMLLRAIVVVIPLLLVIAGDVETNPGPGEPSLKALLHELHSVRASWYNIGIELDIPYTELDCFKQNYSDPLQLMREMLKYWLKTAVDPYPSWEAVVTALKSPLVNEMNVAEQLESKHCAPVQHMQKKPNSANEAKKSEVDQTSASSVETQLRDQKRLSPDCCTPALENPASSGSASPPPTEGSQKPPFGCGCGKCTFFSFIERGCPTPISSASSFPYLDLSGLTHEQQLELRGRLQFESQEIMIRFQELVSATIKSFQKRCVPLDDLVSHVITLGAFAPVFKTEPQVPAFCHCLKELKNADTISKVFMVLNDYLSFFNYRIVEHIIKELGTEEDKAELQRYKKDFYDYAKRRIFECLPEFGLISDADHAEVFVKLDSQYDNYTVTQIEIFRHKLSGILRLSSKGILRLCRVDKGCFQLMFQVPSFVQQKIFPLSKEQKRALAAVGVIKLTCGGECQFLKDELSQAAVVYSTEKHDSDDDSGIGPSTFTDTTSTTSLEGRLDKEMEKLDYELKLHGLVETVSSHKSESGSEFNLVVTMSNIRYLVEEKNCNPMYRTKESFSLFHAAALQGDVEVLKYLITEHNCNPACPGPLGLTPLHLASQYGHIDVVKYLVIEQQMEPLCEDDSGGTPLHRACAHGYQEVAEFLTSELYAPIAELMGDLKNKWSSTPLDSAVAQGHLDILKFFVSDHNCDPNLPGQHGGALLHTAAEFGYLHVIKYLTDVQGCNQSCLDESKYTPLHCAAMKGHTDIVKFLTVEKHCDPMCRDYKGNTPLHFATIRGHMDIVKFFTVEGKCDPMCRNNEQSTPLHKAASNGHIDIVKFLTHELNCNQQCVNSDTPLHLIDERNCNPSCLDKYKRTPLHFAAMKGHMDIVKFLTAEKHSDPMSQDIFNNTALHYAAIHGHLEIVKFLVEELKCPPDIQGALSMTPLQMAILKNRYDIAEYLQKHSVIHTAIAMMKQLGLLK